MREALLRRKGRGLDITITIGDPDDEEKDDKDMGLAPEGTPVGDDMKPGLDEARVADMGEPVDGDPDDEENEAALEGMTPGQGIMRNGLSKAGVLGKNSIHRRMFKKG